MSLLKYLTGVVVCVLVSTLSLHAQLSSPNLIQDEQMQISGITTDAQIYGLSNTQKYTTRKYFDGFGRAIQYNDVQASPAQNDIIVFTTFNSLGQQPYSYLPYVNGSGGNYHSSPASEQTSYYSNGLSDKVTDDADPWAEKVYESSPLLRLVNQGSNGAGFQPVSGGHYKSINYRTYNPSVYTNDSYNTGVRAWAYDGTSSGTYPSQSLSVVEYTDESGHVTDVYYDANKLAVLKREILSPAVTIDGVSENCMDTYYVYDDAAELLFVVPPKALAAIRNANPSPWNVSLAAAANMTYSFVYDAMGRITQKKVPGADWIYIVYDPMSRPVLVQDGNLRNSNKWMYYKYDYKKRPISQGIYTDATHNSLSSMQSYVSGLAGTVYATYYFEEKQPGGTSPNFYTNRIFPTTNYDGSALQDLDYYYFDNYDFNDDGNDDYTYQSQGLSGEGGSTHMTRSMLTGVFKKTLNNDGTLSMWLYSVTLYDTRGQLLQTQSNSQGNTAGGDTRTRVLDFMEKPLIKKVVKTVSGNATTALINYGYDNRSRLSTVDQSNNGGSTVRVAYYRYNELGQLVNKNLHSTDDVNFMQDVDYRYNINGAVTSINNATLAVDNTNYTNADANDLFGEEVLYDKSDASGLGNSSYYNGNVSAVKWKDLPASGNTNERSFVYTYDQMKQLSTAHYSEWSSGGSNWSQAVGYNDENVTAYDLDGNIETLNRFANNTQIDALQYSYNGNQLTNVTDGTANSNGFNGANTTGYTYDNGGTGTGNLTSDPKKGITITYNVLNRTDKISFSNGNYIRYTYDGTGKVIRRDVYTSSTSSTVTYDYIQGFVYQNNVLSYFPMAEGRVRNNSGSLIFEYYIKDHLGNVRVSFDGTGGTAQVRQENSYYPFGMVLPGNLQPSQPNNKLFNGGSEWQNDYANMPDLYRTGFRNYDPELGRFISVDPYAAKFNSLSPYQYGFNNPIGNNDPTGALTQAEFDDAIDAAYQILGDPDYGGGSYSIVSGGAMTYGTADDGDPSFVPSDHTDYSAIFNTQGEIVAWVKTLQTVTVSPPEKPGVLDYLRSGLDITVGVLEIAASVASDGALAPLFGVDGAARIVNAVGKIYVMATDGKEAAEQLPSNLLGDVGAVAFGLGSKGQLLMNTANDIMTAAVEPEGFSNGTLGKLFDFAEGNEQGKNLVGVLDGVNQLSDIPNKMDQLGESPH